MSYKNVILQKTPKIYTKMMIIDLKKTALFLGITAAIFTTSCSNDDDNATGGNPCTPTMWYQDLDGDGLGNPNVSQSDCNQPTGYVSNDDDTDDTVFNYAPSHLPLSAGNYWTYDVEITDPQTSTVTQSRDSLYVNTLTTINNLTYTDLDASATSSAFMTTFFAQNYIRTENEKLHVQGTFDLDLSSLGGNVHTIDINDAVFLDPNANVDTQLYSDSGSITDPVTINGQNVTLTIDYTVKTVQKESLATMDVNGVTFNDISKSNLIISAKIDAQLSVGGFPVTVNVAPLQDINIVENYYAYNIGLIQSDNTFNIDLNPTVANQLGIPTNINAPSNQKIDTYVIN